MVVTHLKPSTELSRSDYQVTEPTLNFDGKGTEHNT